MTGKKFKYDPSSLNYEKIERNLKGKILVVLAYTASSLFLSILLIILYSVLFDTPKEREKRQEYTDLSRDTEMLTEKFQKIDTVIRELRTKDENIYRTIFETEPDNSKETTITDYNYLLNLSNTKIIDSTLLQSSEMLDVIALQYAEYNNLVRNAGVKADILTHIPAIQPVSNKDLTRIASGYGIRLHPTYKIKKFHEGMDFTAPVGTEVYATGDGIVENLDGTRRGPGNTITINHGFNYKTVYSHLDEFKVREGQNVKRGDVIGYVGNTGFSVAPHLHYEVYLKGGTVNPVNYFFLDLSPEMYFRVIQLSLKSGQSFD